MHRITELRKALRLTQSDLAAHADSTRETISSIERGLTEPGIGLALRIAAALGTTAEYAFGASQSDVRRGQKTGPRPKSDPAPEAALTPR